MKTLLQILFFLTLFVMTSYSQEKWHRELLQESHSAKSLMFFQKLIPFSLQGSTVGEATQLDIKNSNWLKELKNSKVEFYEEVFNEKESRIKLNKTIFGAGFLLIELVHQTWNNSNWLNNYKLSYTYNESNYLTESLYQIWNGSTWVNTNMQSITYDGNNMLKEWLYLSWDGSSWVNLYRSIHIYENNISESIYQQWNGNWVNAQRDIHISNGNNETIEWINQNWAGVIWVNDYKFSYTYGGSNILIETLEQDWDGSSWVNYHKGLFAYDEHNNRIEFLWLYWYGSWVNGQKHSFTYDGNNNKIESLLQIWENSAWLNIARWADTYDENNNQIVSIHQGWKGSTWTNLGKSSYSYDENNNRIEDLFQLWGNNDWLNSNKWSYLYDGNNNQMEEIYREWDGTKWRNVDKYIYSPTPTDIEILEIELNSLNLSNNYPNPFNPSTSIKYTVSSWQFVSLKVYDVLGNEVATLVDEYKPVGSYEINFDASHLASGVYLYKLQTDSFVETKKMILMR